MHDPDLASHWKRCVANKEPLTRDQFKQAHSLYITELQDRYGFKSQELKEYSIHFLLDEDTAKKAEELQKNVIYTETIKTGENSTAQITMYGEPKKEDNGKSSEQLRLEKANAINDVLSKKIVKGKGKIYNEIESSIRNFLNNELGKTLGQVQDQTLNGQEIEFVKALVKRALEKETTNAKRI